MISDQDKIKEILRVKNMTNVEFCTQTVMSPATLSNILSQKTKPTLSILRNIQEAFPDLNPLWIYTGEGDMFRSVTPDADTPNTANPSADKPQQTDDDMDDIFGSFRNGLPTTPKAPQVQTPSQVRNSIAQPTINIEEVVGLTMARLQKPQRKVTEVRIFFDDGTYESFSAK